MYLDLMVIMGPFQLNKFYDIPWDLQRKQMGAEEVWAQG